MKNAYRYACVAIFFAGLVAFSQAVTKPSGDAEPARSHVVTFVESRVAPDGSVTVVGWRTRYVKATGEFKSIMRGTNGGEPAIFSRLSDGTYGKARNSSERTLISSAAESAVEQVEDLFRSATFLESHKQFIRTDEVAGLTIFVLRAESDGGEYTSERSFSPKTGLTPLRTITRFKDGGEVRIEAIKVDFCDVPDDLNGEIEALPVKPK